MNKDINKIMLLGLGLAVFLDIAGFFLPMPVYTPLFLHSNMLGGLSMSTRTIMLGVLVSCYGLAQLVGAPILGDLSDQHGRKKTLILALSFSLIGSAINGFSISTHTVFLLYLSRLMVGLSSGTISVVFACIADYSTESQTAKNLGLVGAGAALGAAFGPVIGGHLASTPGLAIFGYATPFYFIALLYLFSIILLIYFLPLDKEKRSKTPINILTGVRNIYRVSKSSPLLRKLVAMGLLFQVSTEGFYLLAPILGVKRLQLLPSDIGNHFLIQGLVSVVISIFLNKYLSKHYKSEKIYLVSAFFLIIGFLTLYIDSRSWFYVPFISIGIFGTLCWIHINNLFSQAANDDEQGLIFGVSQSLWSIGGLVGSNLIALTTAVHEGIGISIPIIFATLSFMFALAITLFNNTSSLN